MIVEQKTHDVEMGGIEEVSNFRIAFTPEAFKILSSTMYSDGLKAILRELGTNATDSQIQAGNPNQKFTVKLPDYLDPTFYIRDYGVGLTPDEIKNIYTSYFTSTKTKDNNTTGCFGLGSKTPFYYTENFSVISYKNGMEYGFAIFINSQGLPSYTKLYEKETIEPNGVKVMFPMKSSDFNDFANKAREIYYWFDVKPEIVGNTIDLDTAPEKFKNIKLAGESWKLFGNANPYYDGNFYVLMGNILYKTTSICKDGNCLLYSNIGDYDITSSREDLKYTPKTVAKLNERIMGYNKEKIDVFNEEIKKCETLYDARLLAIANEKFVDQNTKYNGIQLVNKSGYYADFTVSVADVSLDSCSLRYKRGKHNLSKQIATSIKPDIKNIYIDGTDVKNIDKRVRHYLAANSDKKVFVISCVAKTNLTTQKIRENFINELGIKESMLIDGNTLEVPKRVVGLNSNGSKRAKKGQIKQVMTLTGGYTSKTLEPVDYDENLEGVYVTGPYSSKSWEQIRQFNNFLSELEVTAPQYFIVNEGFDLGDTSLMTIEEFKESLKEDKEDEKELAAMVEHVEKVLDFKKYKNVLCDQAKKSIEDAVKIKKKFSYYNHLNLLFGEDTRPVWLDKYPLMQYINLKWLSPQGDLEVEKYIKDKN